jgi:hypothetical protein
LFTVRAATDSQQYPESLRDRSRPHDRLPCPRLLKVKVILVHAIQACGGQEVRCHSVLTAALDCGKWPAAAHKTIRVEKVKVPLEQASKAQRGSRGIALLFLQPRR